MSEPIERIVVFDLDETLGCFAELGMFWDALTNSSCMHKKAHFFEVMDLFPEFLRPRILTILKTILDRKREGNCQKIMIYTNNQGPKIWSQMIADYFEYKLGEKVFDNIIGAFKVNNNIVEVCRTSHNKNIGDLLKCTKLVSGTRVCFFDDQYHPLMKDESVYYVNVKSFCCSMPFRRMAERYSKRNITNDKRETFNKEIISYMKQYNYNVVEKTPAEYDVDVVVSKQIMIHIDKFFKKTSSRKTKRTVSKSLTRTRKR